VYDARDGNKVFSCAPSREDPTTESLYYTGKGERIICVRSGARVSAWSAASGKAIGDEHALVKHSPQPSRPARPGTPEFSGARYVSPDGVWDLATGRQVWAFGDDNACVAVSPDGRAAATGHPSTGETLLWDISQ
jgi:hypothetical protein